MAEQDDVPELPPGVDRRALERAAVTYYSDPDRISTMPNDWIVTYGRTKTGKLCIQLFRKVFGAPKVVSDFLEVTNEQLIQIQRDRGMIDDEELEEDDSDLEEIEDEEEDEDASLEEPSSEEAKGSEEKASEEKAKADGPFGDGEFP